MYHFFSNYKYIVGISVRFSFIWISHMSVYGTSSESLHLRSDHLVIRRWVNQLWSCSVLCTEWPWSFDLWTHDQSFISRGPRLLHCPGIQNFANQESIESKAMKRSCTCTPHNDKSTSHNDKSTSHNDKSTSHNDKSTSHKDISTPNNDKSTSHNDKSTPNNDKSTSHNDIRISHKEKSTSYYNVLRW